MLEKHSGQQATYSTVVPFDELHFPADVHNIFPFSGPTSAGAYVERLVRLALEEDAEDLTSLGIFSPQATAKGKLVAKQDSLVVGLPLISLVLAELGVANPCEHWQAHVKEGGQAKALEAVASIFAPTYLLLKAERIILNCLTHLCGIANLTAQYVHALEGTGLRLLDTRKTLPGQRYLEKYATRMAGACNHRMDLAQMLMIKNNHVDAAGSISSAVHLLRHAYKPMPPLTIECRSPEEVVEAVMCLPQRILLDNMDCETLGKALPLIPKSIEAEISGNVTLENIRTLALSCAYRPADFISVGRITHSAPTADFSLRVTLD